VVLNTEGELKIILYFKKTRKGQKNHTVL